MYGKRHGLWRLALAIVLVAALAWGCGPQVVDTDDPKEPDEPDDKYGGTLVAAVNTNPAGLDIHVTTETVCTNIMKHVYEALFTTDSDLMLVPHLVDTFEVNEDSTDYLFHLRSGVKFHNGDEMEAADVVASFERWGQLCGRGRTMFADEVKDLIVEDRYSFRLVLNQPNAVLPLVFSDFQSQYVAIMPETIARQYFDKPIDNDDDIIGTGAFKVVEFIPDVHTRLDRFADYSARDEEPDGLSGRRVAYVDTILFRPIPDAMVRLSSVEVGESHHASVMPADEFPRISADPNVNVVLNPLTNHQIAFINMRSGVLAESRLLRQALLAALDLEEIMYAAYGSDDLWEINPSTLVRAYPLWTDAGSELYNTADAELAKQLLAEANYDGTPIVWLGTTDNMQYYAATLAAAAQLERVGFNIDVQIYDWPTVHALRADPEAWNVFNTVMGARPDPVIKPHFNPHWGPYWDNERMLELIAGMRGEMDFAKRMELNEELHRLIATEVPFIVFGQFYPFDVLSPKVMDFDYSSGSALFFHAWLR